MTWRALAETSRRGAGGWPQPNITKAGCIVSDVTMSVLVLFNKFLLPSRLALVEDVR